MAGSLHRTHRRLRPRGFTLVEILIVLTILGILASIVVPRFSAATSDSRDTAAKMQTRELNLTLTKYSMDHNGKYPTLANLPSQLTMWTDAAGNTSATKTGAFTIPPYIMAFPTPGVGPNATLSTVSASTAPQKSGWLYNETAGTIAVNMTP